MALSAKALDKQYGPELSRPPLADCTSEYYLHQALVAKGIQVSLSACKLWWRKYRVMPGQVSIASAAELEEKYGTAIRHLGIQYDTAFKLCGALRQLDPPLYVSDKVAMTWLRLYSSKETIVKVQNAGHLETWYGERIRADMPEGTTDGAVLHQWLLGHLSVSADARVCQKWLTTEWGGKGALITAEAVEECIGERLRLNQYRESFADEAAAQALSELLSESDPPVAVSGMVLRQWYVKYHFDSGPLKYDTAERLNEALGEHMRAVYPGLNSWALHTVLRMRRKAVLVSQRVVRTWCDLYASVSSSVQAAASSAQAVGKRVLKRPAAKDAAEVCKRPAAARSGGVAKRPAAADWEESVSKQQATSASSSTDVVFIKLDNADSVEAACGKRYREQVSDLGLGLTYRDMQVRLKAWGYEAGEVAVRHWLGKYRLGGGAKYGNAAVYALFAKL